MLYSFHTLHDTYKQVHRGLVSVRSMPSKTLGTMLSYANSV